MRSYLDAEQAGKDAGLILLRSYDVATQSSVAGAWYVLLADSHLFRICELLTSCLDKTPHFIAWARHLLSGSSYSCVHLHRRSWSLDSKDIFVCRYSKLAWLKKANIIAFNSALVRVFTFLRIAPAGIKDVHDMLVKVATSLIRGGETGKADLFFQSKAFLSHVTLPALTSTRGDMFSQNLILCSWSFYQLGTECMLAFGKLEKSGVAESFLLHNCLYFRHVSDCKWVIVSKSNCRGVHTNASPSLSEAWGEQLFKGWPWVKSPCLRASKLSAELWRTGEKYFWGSSCSSASRSTP